MNKFISSISTNIKTSIRFQMIAMVTTLITIAAFLLSAVFLLIAYKNATTDMQNTYQNMAEIVSGLSGYNMRFNHAGLQETIDGILKADTYILYAEFTDANGKPIASGGSKEGEKAFREEVGKQITIEGKKAKYFESPITSQQVSMSNQSLEEFGIAPPSTEKTSEIGKIRIAVSTEKVIKLGKRYLVTAIIIIIASIFIGLFVVTIISKKFLSPIFSLMESTKIMAQGSLNFSVKESERKDEMGALAKSFMEMAGGLRNMVKQIQDTYNRLESSTLALEEEMKHGIENNKEQENGLSVVNEHIKDIQNAVQEIGDLMGNLSMISEQTSSSVLEMIASIEEVARNAEGLLEAVNTVVTATDESSSAMREIDRNVDVLNRFVETTASSIQEMEASIRAVDSNAGQAKSLSESVTLHAKGVSTAVEKSINAMEDIQSFFERSAESVAHLGKRSSEIGSIVTVIDEVTDQTNLLSLNAAIIAAQAGEHGKSFAVVADEIRTLAEKTAVSTKEIAALVQSVQEEVNGVVDAIKSGRKVIEEGVSTSREAGSSIQDILKSISESSNAVSEISKATAEQTKGVTHIVKTSDEMRSLSHEIRSSTEEQAKGGLVIQRSSNSMRDLALHVKSATGEQNKGSTIIREAIEKLNSAIDKVLSHTKRQQDATQRVLASLTFFDNVSRKSIASLHRSMEEVESLRSNSQNLKQEITRFKL